MAAARYPLYHRRTITVPSPYHHLIITLSSPKRIRDNPAVRDTSMWDNPKLEWFEAYSIWRSLVEDPERQLEFKMLDGEMTLFDNYRMFHGRRSYTGTRSMEACYVELDHVSSRISMIRQEEAAERKLSGINSKL